MTRHVYWVGDGDFRGPYEAFCGNLATAPHERAALEVEYWDAAHECECDACVEEACDDCEDGDCACPCREDGYFARVEKERGLKFRMRGLNDRYWCVVKILDREGSVCRECWRVVCEEEDFSSSTSMLVKTCIKLREYCSPHEAESVLREKHPEAFQRIRPDIVSKERMRAWIVASRGKGAEPPHDKYVTEKYLRINHFLRRGKPTRKDAVRDMLQHGHLEGAEWYHGPHGLYECLHGVRLTMKDGAVVETPFV